MPVAALRILGAILLLVTPAIGSPELEAAREAVHNSYREAYGEPVSHPDRVIYGEDGRREVWQLAGEGLRALSAGVATVALRSEITDNGDGTYTLHGEPWTTYLGSTVCEEEPFRGQPRLGYCSAFLIDERHVVTAGHCLFTNFLQDTVFIFGFKYDEEMSELPLVVPGGDVYFLSAVKLANLEYYDAAVVELDRPVMGRAPLPINAGGALKDSTRVAVLGHPMNLPMKGDEGARVIESGGMLPYFRANLDTYAGNSGSPVINLATMAVEGILVRGGSDFLMDGGCFRSTRLPDDGTTSNGVTLEEVTKASAFSRFATPPPASQPTQHFSTDNNHLRFTTLTFTPAAGGYEMCRANLTRNRFPIDTTDGDVFSLGDDDWALVELSEFDFPFFGTLRKDFTIMSNGRLGFGFADKTITEGYAAHFRCPGISALFDDLVPVRIEVKQTADLVAVSFDVREYATMRPANFQVVLHSDGTIELHFLENQVRDGLTGISAGLGKPSNFSEVNFDRAAVCSRESGQYLATFDSGAQGWMFFSPSPFVPPDSAVGDSHLSVTTSTPTSFGYWESPIIALSGAVNDVAGDPESILIRALFEVETDQQNRDVVPAFRLRSSLPDFSRSHVYVVESQSPFSHLPVPPGKGYNLIFPVSADVGSTRLDFDVFTTDATGAAETTLRLSTVEVNALDENDIYGPQVVFDIDFAGGGDHSFTPRAAPPLAAPQFAQTPEGLTMRASANQSGETVFGYWHWASQHAMMPGLIYRADFVVTTEATADMRAALSAFRLRLNDSSLQSSAYANIESTGSSLIPMAGEERTYHVFYQVPPELDGNALQFSFDFLHTPGSENDPSLGVTLKRLALIGHSAGPRGR